jgi:hypothetical protein
MPLTEFENLLIGALNGIQGKLHHLNGHVSDCNEGLREINHKLTVGLTDGDMLMGMHSRLDLLDDIDGITQAVKTLTDVIEAKNLND